MGTTEMPCASGPLLGSAARSAAALAPPFFAAPAAFARGGAAAAAAAAAGSWSRRCDSRLSCANPASFTPLRSRSRSRSAFVQSRCPAYSSGLQARPLFDFEPAFTTGTSDDISPGTKLRAGLGPLLLCCWAAGGEAAGQEAEELHRLLYRRRRLLHGLCGLCGLCWLYRLWAVAASRTAQAEEAAWAAWAVGAAVQVATAKEQPAVDVVAVTAAGMQRRLKRWSRLRLRRLQWGKA